MQNPNCNPAPYFMEHIKLHIDIIATLWWRYQNLITILPYNIHSSCKDVYLYFDVIYVYIYICHIYAGLYLFYYLVEKL